MDSTRNDPADRSYLPSYTPSQRAPPPSGPPPVYAAALERVYPYTLRPVILFTTFIAFLYLLLFSISRFQNIGDSSSTAKSNVFDAIQGVLLILASLIVAIGFVGAIRQTISLSKLYARLSLPAYLIVVAAQIVGLISHFSLKSQTIDACSKNYTGAVYRSGSWWWDQQTSGILTSDQAREYCNNRWKSQSTWAIVWLVITVIIGIPFVIFSFAYLRQLSDPASVRNRAAANQLNQNQFNSSPPYDPQAQAFPLQTYPQPPQENRFHPPAYPYPHNGPGFDYDRDVKSPIVDQDNDHKDSHPNANPNANTQADSNQEDDHRQSTSARPISDHAPRI